VKVLGKSPHYIFVILNVLRTERKVNLDLKKRGIEFGEIQILIVSKGAQGIGVGSKLLKNLLQTADEANIIVKTQSSEARNFYEKHGFIQIMENRIVSSQLFILSYSKGK
jgi:GNAT superfamily N-acetyltransferase